MVTIRIVLGLLAVLIVATVIDNKRRRSVREATLPPGISRSARGEYSANSGLRIARRKPDICGASVP